MKANFWSEFLRSILNILAWSNHANSNLFLCILLFCKFLMYFIVFMKILMYFIVFMIFGIFLQFDLDGHI